MSFLFIFEKLVRHILHENQKTRYRKHALAEGPLIQLTKELARPLKSMT